MKKIILFFGLFLGAVYLHAQEPKKIISPEPDSSTQKGGNPSINAAVTTGGTATSGYISKFTSTTNIEPTVTPIFEDATNSRIGIGTTTPNKIFEVEAGSSLAANTTISYLGGTTTSTYGTSVILSNRNTAGWTGIFLNESASSSGSTPGGIMRYNSTHASLAGEVSVFSTNYLTFGSGGSITERMRITSGGNVGIGTTSPLFATEIVGTSAACTTGATANGTIGLGGTGTNGVLNMGVDGSGTFYSWIQSRHRSSADFYALSLNPNGGNVGIGTNSSSYKLDVSGGDINVDYNAGYRIGGNLVLSTFAGMSFTAVGVFALAAASGADWCTAVGHSALTSNTSGSSNTAIGAGALSSNTIGNSNTACGGNLTNNTKGGSNSAVGNSALRSNTTGGENVAVGNLALYSQSYSNSNSPWSSYNIAVGNYALYATNANASTSEGIKNTATGYKAGYTITTGTNNVCLGYWSDASATVTNAAAIGANTTVTASNCMRFGDANVVDWGFGTTPGSSRAFEVGTSTSNGNGAYLTDGGAWTNGSSRTFKDNITPIEGKDILDKIEKLEIARWRYMETEEYHIGPFAEDFYQAFQTGLDDKHISTIDPSGVALAAIKELIKECKEQKEEIKNLQSQIQACCAANASTPNNNGGQLNATTIHELELTNSSVLFQNFPNPFGEGTTIKYFVPDNSNAQIIFYDEFGNKLKEFSVVEKGMGQLNLSTMNLAAGVYSYSLVVNGKIVDTKKMVKTN